MATIHSFGGTRTSSLGLWIKSADGKEEIMLDPKESIALAQEIMAQARPSRRSATPARRSAPTVTQRSAPVSQRSAPTLYKTANRVTGKRQFTGKPYENTIECWSELTEASKAARYLEYVNPDAFVDRRNDDPIIHLWQVAKQAENPEIFPIYDSVGDIEMPTLWNAPHYRELEEFKSPQRYHLEIWCEKSTMNDILEQIAIKYSGVLLYGKGELSITAALKAIQRFQESGKPVRIFYVSDFDPAGACMPVSMSRKLEYFVRKEGLDLDIKLFPVVLTYEQTKQYPKLLPTPIKESEKRKAGFEAKYGKGAIELDALEALYPGELKKILDRELGRYYDRTLRPRVAEFHKGHTAKLAEIQESVYAEYADEMQGIESEAAELKDEWQAIREFDRRILGDNRIMHTSDMHTIGITELVPQVLKPSP